MQQEEDDGDNDSDLDEVIHFTCRLRGAKYNLHTHAPIENLLYHLGPLALKGEPSNMELMSHAVRHWNALNKKAAQAVLKKLPALKIRVPGGKMKNVKGSSS